LECATLGTIYSKPKAVTEKVINSIFQFERLSFTSVKAIWEFFIKAGAMSTGCKTKKLYSNENYGYFLINKELIIQVFLKI